MTTRRIPLLRGRQAVARYSAVGASERALAPASSGATLASTPGQPLGSHVHVNSLASPHELGSVAHVPPFAVKHQPQPVTGVHEPHVV